MKIRSGFVSNSSSSSFVLVVKKELYDTVMSGLDPLHQAIMEATMRPDNVLWHECMVYENCSSDYWFDDIDIPQVIERAKEIAKGKAPIVSNKIPIDPEEREIYFNDIVSDGLFNVEYYFRNYADAVQIWSHNMDW